MIDAAKLSNAVNTPVRARSNLELAARRFVRHKLAMAGFIVTLLLLILGICAPLIAPYDYSYSNLMSANQFPSREHLFGTDAIGRDYFSRILFGLRTSLMVGFVAVAISCAIGIPLGLLAGLGGNWADFLVMRLVEVMTAFPGLLFAIFLVSVLGSGVRNVILVIGLTAWLTICRLTRAQLLTLREQEYVFAARSVGVAPLRIAFRHLLPNALAPIVIVITLSIPVAIFTEAGLSFLGIGINEPTPSLGKMVSDGAPYMQVYWYLGFFPTVAIALAMLGFTFLGDGLRDALDPRQG
ncbi:MAG: ABC transporter permease [Thermomicrobiales bacterium]|nr:ABC transporter permease [Thermomicrobiales bacterium]